MYVLGQMTFSRHFYPRNALHNAVFAVEKCPPVCPSHAGIVTKRLNLC